MLLQYLKERLKYVFLNFFGHTNENGRTIAYKSGFQNVGIQSDLSSVSVSVFSSVSVRVFIIIIIIIIIIIVDRYILLL